MEEILTLYQELRGLFDEHDLVAEFSRQIHDIIQEAIDQIPAGSRIAIRPAGGDTKKLLRLHDFSKKNIIGIVSPSDHGDNFLGYPYFTKDLFSPETCDCMIICSFYYHQEIKEELETLHIPYIDIYGELEKRGFQLPLPYYLYETHPNLVANYFYLRYLRSETGPKREIALNTLLHAAVECKDFVLISNIYKDCGGEEGEFPLLKTVWRKSSQLLNRIQNKLHERKQKDIILFWTDAISYDLMNCLPRTAALSKQGVLFQRSYTNAPGTDTTMSAMFCNMLPIDDFPRILEKISSKNSPLIRFMEDKGYKIRFIGSSDRAMGRKRLLEVRDWLPCNMNWWEGIIDLLQSPEPCFYMFHFLESHIPCYVSDLKEPVDIGKATPVQQKAQIEAALGYLDQCLLFYHRLLGDKIQIFFSDHGNGLLVDKFWIEQSLHTYCFAVGKNIPKMTVNRFFPYTNFEKFVQWLVDPAHVSLDEVCADEVIFQNIDYYNPEVFDGFIKEKNPKKGIAYRGIINYDYKYVINALGEESFCQIQPDGTERPIPLEDPVLRAELRDKIGTAFLDIYRYDEFRYTRKLYDFIKSTEAK